MLFCGLLIFSKSTFSKKYFRNANRVSNSFDPDQARRYVGPDLGPNCLKRLSADDTRRPTCISPTCAKVSEVFTEGNICFTHLLNMIICDNFYLEDLLNFEINKLLLYFVGKKTE